MREMLFANGLVKQTLAFGFILDVDICSKNTWVNIQLLTAFASLTDYELVPKLSYRTFKFTSRILKVEWKQVELEWKQFVFTVSTVSLKIVSSSR